MVFDIDKEKGDAAMIDKQGWTSADDPPKDGEDVLVYLSYFHGAQTDMDIGFYDNQWFDKRERELEGVTHWMPLSDPPEVDK